MFCLLVFLSKIGEVIISYIKLLQWKNELNFSVSTSVIWKTKRLSFHLR